MPWKSTEIKDEAIARVQAGIDEDRWCEYDWWDQGKWCAMALIDQCRPSHSPIEAGQRIQREMGLDADEMRFIVEANAKGPHAVLTACRNVPVQS